MQRRRDESFPSHGAFARLGRRDALIALLAEWCQEQPSYHDVRAICQALLATKAPQAEEGPPVPVQVTGRIYMVKSGKYYKIGRSNDTGRRLYEIKLQLPERGELVHSIDTDDPVGIERYWHERFADRRKNGEWFLLSREDIAAFKRRRRFM